MGELLKILDNKMVEQAISIEWEEKPNEPMPTYLLQKICTLVFILPPM
jgi:hypothetical protein